eukprot:TRINITY_DN1323_c0_g2_i1.p1 TRINITY_DN1323_c0_g2~~TRINITY_DN1323_c0_g2_i1.p1  ORF type:complete len:347 (+),score=56.61 TRINITY_DN1323_c0_g2_i1:56-1096(+)
MGCYQGKMKIPDDVVNENGEEKQNEAPEGSKAAKRENSQPKMSKIESTRKLEKIEPNNNNSPAAAENNEQVEVEDPNDRLELESGSAAVQGLRQTMEDTHVHIDQVEDLGDCSFYAVYDGHCGKEAADICEIHVHKNIFESDAFRSGEVEAAIKHGFVTTDSLILETGSREGWKTGSTAVISVIKEKFLYVGNVGDSEAVLGQKVEEDKYTPVLCTEKHKAATPSEKKRIQEAGGTVIYGRVFGDLAISRSFGDSDYKKPKAEGDFISVEPHVKKLKLKRSHEFLVLACDGLWDVITYQDCVNIVSSMRKEGKNPTEIATFLTQEALTRKSQDNVTTVVILFTWTK